MALGLISSEQIDDFWSQNTRRRIFYEFPNGTAPLTGLLSLMDTVPTPHPEFGWEEKRWQSIKTQTKASPVVTGNKTGPFTNADGTTASGDSDGIFSLTAGSVVRVYVDNADDFQIDTVIKVFDVGVVAGGSGTTASGYVDVVGRVVALGAGYVNLQVTRPYTNLSNYADNSVDRWAYSLGSAFAEAARSRTGRIKFPYTIKNNTQIFKTAFELSRTALKEPLKYDKTGVYRDICKDNGIDHLSQIELAAFFGERATETDIDPDTGQTVPRRFTGGIKWFIEQYEEGTAYGLPNITNDPWQDTPGKRIIKLAGNTITKSQFNELISRVFERTNAADWSKLCLCGTGYLNKVADMFERQIQYTSLREHGFKGFDFELVKHNSNAGTVYYKTHPLFNDPLFRNSAFYIDLGYMNYRPLTDSDTDIQPMIQPNDADKRKDQWLTECGFEIPFPEAFMYVENLGGITL